MQDIKVIDTLRKMDEDEGYVMAAYYHSPLLFFAEAVALTRNQNGVSIEDIAKCFKHQFDAAELEALVKNLTK